MPLTKDDKKSIDLLTPVLIMGVAGFYAYRKTKNWQMIALVLVAAYLLGYIVTSQITRRIYLSGPAPVPTGGGCASYDPSLICVEAHKDIYSWGFRDLSPYKKMLILADCQLISVYNYWNKVYYREDRETLPQAISNEGSFGVFDDENVKQPLLQKFQRLGLQ